MEGRGEEGGAPFTAGATGGGGGGSERDFFVEAGAGTLGRGGGTLGLSEAGVGTAGRPIGDGIPTTVFLRLGGVLATREAARPGVARGLRC